MIEFPARLARLRHLDERGAEAKAVAEKHILLVAPQGRDILPARPRRLAQRDDAQIPAPPVQLFGGIMMDGLVHPALHPADLLLLTGTAPQPDSPPTGHRQ